MVDSIYAYEIPESESSKRVDQWIVEKHPETSRSQLKKRIKKVLVNEKEVKLSHSLNSGDRIVYTLAFQPKKTLSRYNPEIIFEDDFILVLNKAAGKVVYPKIGHAGDTVADYLEGVLGDLSDFEEPERAGIVHRLDKETSGVLICAKDAKTEGFLKRQFKRRRVKKEYHAIVRGSLYQSQGTIESPIGVHPQDRKKRHVTDSGKHAVTHYEVMDRRQGLSLLRIHIETGRTHQIRVHLSHLGFPVLGDKVYSRNDSKEKHLYLCANALSVLHPHTGEDVSFTVNLPGFFHERFNEHG